MFSQRLANIVFMVLTLAGCIYFAKIAQGFEAAGLMASSGLPSKFFPLLMLGLIALCAIIVFATYVIKGTASDKDEGTLYASPLEAFRGLLTLIAVIAGYFIWSTWGYLAMAVFIGPATCLAMGVRSPAIYATVLVLAGSVYLIFTQLLGTQF